MVELIKTGDHWSVFQDQRVIYISMLTGTAGLFETLFWIIERNFSYRWVPKRAQWN